jgi:hypothetical protein
LRQSKIISRFAKSRLKPKKPKIFGVYSIDIKMKLEAAKKIYESCINLPSSASYFDNKK